MVPNTYEVIANLLEDHSVLMRDLQNEEATPIPGVIRSVHAPILRKWMEPQGIYRLQNVLGKKFRFPCRDFKKSIRACENGSIQNWVSPIRLIGLEVSTLLPKPEFIGTLRGASDADEHNVEVLLETKDCFQQKLMFNDGRFLRRSEIVTIFSNRHGGTHSIGVKKDIDLIAEEFRRLLGFSLKDNNIQMISGTDFDNAESYKRGGNFVFDPFQLYVLDSTRRFCKGVEHIKADLLREIK